MKAVTAAALVAEIDEINEKLWTKLRQEAEKALSAARMNPYAARRAFAEALRKDASLQIELESFFLNHVSQVLMPKGPHSLVPVQPIDVRKPVLVAPPGKSVLVSEHYRASIRSAMKDASSSFLVSFRVRDGRPLGKVRWRELGYLATTNEYEAKIIRALQTHFARVPDDEAMIETLISDKVMDRIRRKIDNEETQKKIDKHQGR